MKADAVLLAAGTGERFGGAKQLAPLLGRPVLAHALEDLLSLAIVARIAIVVPTQGREAYARAVADVIDAGGPERIRWAEGGPTRRTSVSAGLAALSGANALPTVLVHDAARPYVSARVVEALLDVLTRGSGMLPNVDGVVPVLPEADTLRWRDRPGGPDRGLVLRVQTPQAFLRDRLEGAHAWGGRNPGIADAMTDDASLVEAWGGRIAQVAGDSRAEKITRPEDLALATARLRGTRERACPDRAGDLGGPQADTARTGLGLDHHRLATGRPLWLCGLEIPWEEGLVGHSDGDVALHALVNALLGAVGARDIGMFFPPGNPAFEGLGSAVMVATALGEVTARGFRPVHAQIVLTAERPRLSMYVPDMIRSVSRLLGLADAAAAVHATTGEGLLKDAIEAHAVVTVEPMDHQGIGRRCGLPDAN